METQNDTLQRSVRERLKALKDEASGTVSTTLPVSGIAVTYPAFIAHGQVMAAQKIAGKDRSKIGSIMVAQVCLFEGERLTVDEITGELLQNRDTVHLINKILGVEDEDEEGSGN